MADTLTCLHFLSAEHFTSGADIAASLGVSRASVSTALASAEDYGITLTRRTGAGYRLSAPIDWLDRAQVLAALPEGSRIDVDIVQRTDSTNRRLLAAPVHARALVAEWQDGGRGRLGRRWLAQLGGSMMFSLAWRFEGGTASLSGLSLAVGAIVADALRDTGVQLKWPNDLLLDGAKVGGILIEIAGDAMGPTDAVIGIGLNLIAPAAVTDQACAGLADHGAIPERNVLLARLLAALERGLNEFTVHGFAPFKPRWEAFSAWHGQQVELIAPDGSRRAGTLAGLADDGSLRLATDAGELVVHTGDLSLRRTEPAR
ncbi:biotin--[acetyl-CoA-carboxylase] ligase [Jeongeupia naejangsanensis]|uniref:biotin--[biotin carboxyl-carrier protein] ligase n=1 Tax=Jeongeupia naejangsanensis TaxID=613195 RepID=A0ABS2BNW8_9NEIS|nr:biotin--[acetyl-CoA-carboxylase] ligase [Jeongeupia naejangsanensis]MBM3117317.1 biotin--[acetyl-CoA-carboxylase] ligase [Jeongeupia naejangsanensis]